MLLMLMLTSQGDIVRVLADRDLSTALQERCLTISEHILDVHVGR
jgi:hypothetical protein